MLKKFLMLLFVLTLVSACASKKTTVEEEYDVIETQEQADKMNKKAKNAQEINVPDRVYFAFNKYNVSDDSAEILNIQADWLKSESKTDIIVEGHCDERGTREYNLALGERRAMAVKNYLVKQGIPTNRIKTISYGKEKPVVFGTGEAVWAKNRVAVTVVAK